MCGSPRWSHAHTTTAKAMGELMAQSVSRVGLRGRGLCATREKKKKTVGYLLQGGPCLRVLAQAG